MSCFPVISCAVCELAPEMFQRHLVELDNRTESLKKAVLSTLMGLSIVLPVMAVMDHKNLCFIDTLKNPLDLIIGSLALSVLYVLGGIRCLIGSVFHCVVFDPALKQKFAVPTGTPTAHLRTPTAH